MMERDVLARTPCLKHLARLPHSVRRTEPFGIAFIDKIVFLHLHMLSPTVGVKCEGDSVGAPIGGDVSLAT
jgi:hypothetical protein